MRRHVRDNRPLLVLALTCSVAISERAWAEPAPRERALKLFGDAKHAYQAGELDRAIELLREARAIFAEPVLLYNLARAYESRGDYELAISAYRQYLREQPDAKDRGILEARVETLERERDERARLRVQLEREAAERRLAQQRATEATPRSSSVAPWIVAGSGGVVVTAGVVFGVFSRRRGADAANEPIHRDAQATLDDARTYADVANASFVVGGLAIAGGLAWAYLRRDRNPSRPSAALVVGGSSIALSWRIDLR
jgi:tetratricopeptide (TPR) repeat protein